MVTIFRGYFKSRNIYPWLITDYRLQHGPIQNFPFLEAIFRGMEEVKVISVSKKTKKKQAEINIHNFT